MSAHDPYHVRTDVFEGPFDLLLTLIEKRKLLVSDISLAAVTDDFIAHLQQQKEFPLSQAASFAVTASTLLLIKSRALLPLLSLSDEESGDIKDLQKRLALYQRFKEIGKSISTQYGARVLFAAGLATSAIPVFAPSHDLSLKALSEGIQNVLASLPKFEKKDEVRVTQVVSLEEMIDRLTTRIEKSLAMNFKDFSSAGKAEKVEIVVSFLAMLELVKQGIIHVSQNEHFGDIEMRYDGTIKAPSYS